MFLVMLQMNGFLSLFADKPKTAWNWFLISLAVGFAVGIALLALKYLWKRRTNDPVWSRSRNLLHLTLGASPVLLALLAMQFSDPDYRNYSNYGYGALAALVTYIVSFLFVHLVYKDWRTEIF
jgi:hypothetical protein